MAQSNILQLEMLRAWYDESYVFGIPERVEVEKPRRYECLVIVSAFRMPMEATIDP